MQTVKMILDSQFESMGLAIGQIAKIKALMLSENKGAEKSEGMSMCVNAMCEGAVASCIICSSPARAVRVRALTGDIVLCPWAGRLTLAVPFSTQEYHEMANCWGN